MKRSNMSRRSFLKSSAVLTLAPALRACSSQPDRPNLLFLWTDEQRFNTMAAYGNTIVHAPNLNRLASESVVFKRAYCTQPVCSPSRAAILTGLWPHETGCLRNNVPLKPETKALPELLDDSEYRTAYMGKWHLGDEIFPQHGFEEWEATEDNYGDFYGEEGTIDDRSSYHHFLLSQGYAPNSRSKKFGRGFSAKLPFEHCKPDFLRRRASDFLRRHRNDPFILHVSYLEPHMPFYGPLDDEHDPDDVQLPPNFSDPLEDNEPLRSRIFRQWYYENGWEEAELKTEEDWRKITARYWGLVTQVDRSVGDILSTLEELGLADNTIVVFTSDHGDMMGEHRLFTKTFSYEGSSRIPLMIRYPRRQRQQIVVEQPVSQIDIVPTLLDLMGKRLADFSLPGQSLAPLFSGETVTEAHVFVQWNSYYQDLVSRCKPEAVEPFTAWLNRQGSKEEIDRAIASEWRMVVSPDGWKLCLAVGDKSQLFNLAEDPYEIINLFDSGRHSEVIARLTEKIHVWQSDVGDTLEVG